MHEHQRHVSDDGGMRATAASAPSYDGCEGSASIAVPGYNVNSIHMIGDNQS